MKISLKMTCLVLMLVIATSVAAYAKPVEGTKAPLFSLKDTNGKLYDLSSTANSPMTIIYFFDANSRPSVEGLLSLNDLAMKHKKADLTVWAITASPKAKAVEFAKKNSLAFPVLMDNAKVSDAYNAKLILPTMCIIGPRQKVIDFFQGGGKTTTIMLGRLAERKLQQKQNSLAEAISDTVIKKNPDDAKAKMTKGYAALKAGKLDEAEKIFTELSKGKGISEILGKEGLAALYVRKGNTAMALKLVDEIESKAPERIYASTLRADILYSKNEKEKAKAEYARAAKKKEGESFQKAATYNKLGRLYAGAKDYKGSRELYDRAVEMDPYYVEAMANKGITYEKEGNYDNALGQYQKAGNVSANDAYTMALMQNVQEMIKLQKDTEKMNRINKLVTELAERYKKIKKDQAKKDEIDSWTSPITVLAFVDIDEKGALSERDGMATVLTTDLTGALNSSGRVKVVDRMVLDKLLTELDLGSSELANPETSLKLGKVMAAKIIGTGTVLNIMDKPSKLSLRLIDTETTAIADTISREINFDTELSKGVNNLNRDILAAVIKKYPLKGFVVSNDNGKIMINIGADQGVVNGTVFEVLGEQKVVEYKGKKLQPAPNVIGEIEITSTEPGLSNAKIIRQDVQITKDSRISEKYKAADNAK